MKDSSKKAVSLKTLNKSNVWDIQENDIFRLWEAAEKDADLKENTSHYLDIIRSAFDIEEMKIDKPQILKKYEARGFKIGQMRMDENTKLKFAVKKKPINRVTDLTYENIRHISAAKLMEVIDRNFGGGWDSLSQSIQDIIQSGFDISTTTLPKDRLHKHGGMYEKKVEDGFEVLEIPKGSWVEAIFAKVKPQVEMPKMVYDEHEDLDQDDLDDEDEGPEVEDHYNDDLDDEDEYDDDKLTEESYRTTIDENPEDLDLNDVEVADDDDY
jgi:predicted transcriptional regulator YdeE